MVCFTLLRSPLVSSKPAPFLSRSRGQTSRRSPDRCWSLADVYTHASLGTADRDSSVLVFAISENEVSFEEFARLFRDKLGCENALFLDGGSATSFYSPESGRKGNLVPLGPMIGVYERAN